MEELSAYLLSFKTCTICLDLHTKIELQMTRNEENIPKEGEERINL